MYDLLDNDGGSLNGVADDVSLLVYNSNFTYLFPAPRSVPYVPSLYLGSYFAKFCIFCSTVLKASYLTISLSFCAIFVHQN
jgi:hypothetical protein